MKQRQIFLGRRFGKTDFVTALLEEEMRRSTKYHEYRIDELPAYPRSQAEAASKYPDAAGKALA
jgi:hypothetical protein